MVDDLVVKELNDLPYYHGIIDSNQAVKLLKHEKPGTYLLRTSPNSSHKGAFTISVIKNSTAKRTDIYHFVVMGEPGAYFARNDAKFERIHRLIEHYKSNDYENHLDIPSIRLTYPLKNPDYVNPYSYATVENRYDELIAHLREMEEEMDEEICDCGMKIKDARLPNGWMIHQTKPETRGEKVLVFFQHDELNLTQWELPQGMRDHLTPTQQRLIARYGVD